MRSLLHVAAGLLCCAAVPAGALAQQKCTASSDTTTLPPLAQVADSSALAAALAAAGGEEPVSLLRVEYEKNGRPREVEAYRRSGPVDGAVDVARRLLPLFRARPGRKEPFLFWIARVEGPTAGIRFARFRQECMPALENREETARRLQEVYQQARARKRDPAPSRAEARVRMRVDARGEPTEVRLQERTGNVELDVAAVRIARQMRFLPARVDAYPVSAWITMPLRFYGM